MWLKLAASSWGFLPLLSPCTSEMLWPFGSCVCAFLAKARQFSMVCWADSCDSSFLFGKMTLEVNYALCLSCLCRMPTGLGKTIVLEVRLNNKFTHMLWKSRLQTWEEWAGCFPEYLGIPCWLTSLWLEPVSWCLAACPLGGSGVPVSLAAICSRLVRKPDQCPFQSGLMLGCKLSGTLGEVLDPKLSSFTYLFSQHLLTFVVLAVLSLQSVTEQNGLNTSK